MSQAINGHISQPGLLAKPVNCATRLLEELIDPESYHLSRHRAIQLMLFIIAPTSKEDGV
jgi:hypothetical protein